MAVWSALLLSLAFSASPSGSPPACTTLANQFCEKLFDPEHQGHWEMSAGKEVLRARRGYTNNGLPESMARVLELRLERRDRFPVFLREELERLGYYREAHGLLTGHSHGDSLDDELRRRGQDTLLPHLWDAGLDAAAFRQLVKLHPTALSLDDTEWPPDWEREEKQARDALAIAANRATWTETPEWVHARQSFEETRVELKRWLAEHPAYSKEQAAAVEVDLDTLQLLPPGTRSPASESCASSDLNAYYDEEENTIEVCAGELFTPTLTETMAHEMAHVLGPSRQELRAQRMLELARWFQSMRTTLCRGERLSCSDWARGKARLPRMLKEWQSASPEPLGVFRCLQSQTLRPPDLRPMVDEAVSRVSEQVQRLATDNLLLTLTRKETMTPQGARHPNPAYLNPCRAVDEFERWPPLSSEVTGPIALVAEYQCGGQGEASSPERLEHAIDAMKQMQLKLTAQELSMANAYSSDDWRVEQGYSEDETEDFADFVASQVFTQTMAKETDLKARRVWFMAAIADYCEEPGWSAEFPAETAVQARLNPDSHAPSADRRARFFRSAGPLLGCTVDSAVKACPWKP